MKLHLDIRNESARKRLYRRDQLRAIAEAVLASEAPRVRRRSLGYELSVLFCDDPFIADLNRRYRNKRGPTDVLSFAQDFADHGHPEVLGDIVISIETVERFCKGDRAAMRAEVRLLFCHGLLHLLGHEHATEHGRETMTALQAQFLGISQQAAWHQRTAPEKRAARSRARGGA